MNAQARAKQLQGVVVAHHHHVVGAALPALAYGREQALANDLLEVRHCYRSPQQPNNSKFDLNKNFVIELILFFAVWNSISVSQIRNLNSKQDSSPTIFEMDMK